MTTEVLKEYLGMIADLERDLYEYLKIEASIDKKLRKSYVLPVERSFEEYCKNHFYDTTLAAFPSEKAPTEPSKPRREDFQGKDFRTSPGLIFLTIIAGIIFLPCVFIIPLMANRKQKKEEENLYNNAFERYKAQKRKYDEYSKKQQEYNEKYEMWNKEKSDYKTRLALNKAKSEPYTLMMQRVKEQYENTRHCLCNLYAKCNIYHKYQNLAAVCSFYDYIAAGICTKLEGSDGAYNKYDIEMRMDRMITQLDEVIENLHIIQNNQIKLYDEMCGISQKIDKLQSSMDAIATQLDYVIMGLGAIYEQGAEQIEQLAIIRSQTEKLLESSELNNYLVECNNRQLNYMNRMNYLAGNYDNPYGNYSPV